MKYDRHNITGAIFKNARQDELSVSQTLITQHTGISSKDISQFENGKSLLTDEKRDKLASFLNDKLNLNDEPVEPLEDDFAIDANEPEPILKNDPESYEGDTESKKTPPSPSVKDGFSHVDGVIIPPALLFDDAEKIISRYHDNMKIVESNLDKVVPRSFGGDIDLDSVLEGVVLPAIRALSSLHSLTQGDELFPTLRPENKKIDKDASVVTYQDAIGHLLATKINRGIF